MIENEPKFLGKVKSIFEQAVMDLDATTMTRLRIARRQALENRLNKRVRKQPIWLLPLGGIAAAGIVIAVAGLFWLGSPNGLPPWQASVDDIELLMARENPDFFADLDFFAWLDNSDSS